MLATACTDWRQTCDGHHGHARRQGRRLRGPRDRRERRQGQRADRGGGMSPHGTLRAADGGSSTRRPGGGGRMLGLGLRLAVSGGREALVRLVVLAIAVSLGVGLLLIAVAGINAVNAQNDRYAWLDTAGSSQSHQPDARSAGAHYESPPPATASRAPAWFLVTTDEFGSQD